MTASFLLPSSPNKWTDVIGPLGGENTFHEFHGRSLHFKTFTVGEINTFKKAQRDSSASLAVFAAGRNPIIETKKCERRAKITNLAKKVIFSGGTILAMYCLKSLIPSLGHGFSLSQYEGCEPSTGGLVLPKKGVIKTTVQTITGKINKRPYKVAFLIVIIVLGKTLHVVLVRSAASRLARKAAETVREAADAAQAELEKVKKKEISVGKIICLESTCTLDGQIYTLEQLRSIELILRAARTLDPSL